MCLLKAPGTVGVGVLRGEPELIEEAASPQGFSCVWNKERVGPVLELLPSTSASEWWGAGDGG